MSQHPALPVRGLNGDWARPMELIGSDLANPVQLIDNAEDNDLQAANTRQRIYRGETD